jgi:hypothetical protein
MNNPTFQYETIGNKSFLVATLGGAENLINYQLQMLVNNEIPNILSVNKRRKNDDVQLCYNVTSKITLAQATGRNKISKRDFLTLIKGVLRAYKELDEYRLVRSGLVFDNEYIFVKPGGFDPSFVYLPIYGEERGIDALKGFLLNMILQSKVEVTNDNFIQVLLEALNAPALNTEELGKIIKSYGDAEHSESPVANRPTPARPQETFSPLRPQEMYSPARQTGPVESAPGFDASPVPPVSPGPVVSPGPSPAPSPIPQGIQAAPHAAAQTSEKKSKLKTGKKEKAPKREKQPSAWDAHPKKNPFLVLQIVILGVIVALSVSGALNDEAGNLKLSYLGGLLILVLGADFVLYREWFKNSGAKEKTKASEKKPGKKSASHSPSVPIPGKTPPEVPRAPQTGHAADRPASPPSPDAVPQVPPPYRPIASAPLAASYAPPAQSTPVAVPCSPPAQGPAYAPNAAPMPRRTYNPDTAPESDDTVIDCGNAFGGACLEYFENGLLTKIRLDKPSVIVGRMKSQVDCVLSDSKVGKVHAEFIFDRGDYYVKDYNSTNGTYINGSGQRIPGNTPCQIHNGDRISLANIELTLRC